MEFKIIYLDLPCRVKGVTVMDETGFFNVYINAQLSYDVQRAAIAHELTHIARNDFYSEEPLEKVEQF